MLTINKESFGYKIIFSGIITIQEVENWLVESESILLNSPNSFSVYIDMREMEILPVECQALMFEGQKLYKRMGMDRSVVVVGNKLTAMQFSLIAQKTGIYKDERYIDASLNANWHKEAMNWIISCIEPFNDHELVK